jgi:threonine/homoserine/homoserine lactone efflux protein
MGLYMVAAAAGLSALFLAVPIAYDAVRLAGAAYLLWLAHKVLTRRSSSMSTSAVLEYERAGQPYRRGFLTCLLNPKALVTYGALLPQFVRPDAGHVLGQTISLGLTQIVAAACAYSLVILGAAAVASALSRRHAFANIQRHLLGTVFAALAIRLVAERGSVV